jgi:hypothetical protein
LPFFVVVVGPPSAYQAAHLVVHPFTYLAAYPSTFLAAYQAAFPVAFPFLASFLGSTEY